MVRRKETPKKKFLILDAGMNDLMRPSLYGAYHEIQSVRETDDKTALFDVVGPVCETTDCFAEKRPLPPLKAGDLVAIRDAGAYGSSMSSEYNSRPLVAEVLVESGRVTPIRIRREVDACWESELSCLTL